MLETKTQSRPRLSNNMKRCGKCNSLTDDTLQVCPHDGSALEVDFIAAELQETLGDKYTLTQLIGQGSMGAVYRARHRDLDEVAIKIMLGQKNNAQLSERFLREARALRRLRHPNAVLVYDLERSSNGVSFMVMEMVKGASLRHELDKRRTLPLEEVVAIAEAVCAALQEAHELGIIHRDIKPDNILVAEEMMPSGRAQRRIKLVDFGVVKLPAISPDGDPERPITRAGTPIGTPFYMSPEQWFGEGSGIAALDGRADIYALGCTLYEMLTGRVPFYADNTKEMRRLHLQADPQPLAELAPNVPWPVNDVIMRAMTKDREERQSSAQEFAAELRAAYNVGFRETAQLSAERLAAARAAWGESDAPINQQQIAPTYKSQSDAGPEDDSAVAETEDFRLAPTDSGEKSELLENISEAEETTVDTNLGESSVNAWAPTASPEPPAPGDTFLTNLVRRTSQLERPDTVQGRLPDLTVPPPVLPEQVTEEVKAAPEPPKVPELPPKVPELPPKVPEPLPPKVPEPREREATTHQLYLPNSVLVKSPPPLPEALPVSVEPAKADLPKVAPPAPSPVSGLRKAVVGAALAGLVIVGGGIAYWKWPRPDPPNTNQSAAPGNPGDVRVPGFGFINVAAPKDSIIYVDDEQIAKVGDNGASGAQATPGVRHIRVQPAAANLRPFIQNVRVTANSTVEVKAVFARQAEAAPAASAEIRHQRAKEFATQANYAAAEAEYRQLLEEKPGDTEARVGLARVLAAEKRYGEAAVELETTTRMMPKNVEVLRELARLQAIKRQDGGAERNLLQALRQAPRNSSLHADFARLLARQPGRLNEALREADLGLKSRETAETLDAKARVLIERGAAPEALKLAERAVKREPREPAWQATLAVALERAGQPAAAQAKFRPLLQKNRDEWGDRKTLGMLRFYGKTFLETVDALIAR